MTFINIVAYFCHLVCFMRPIWQTTIILTVGMMFSNCATSVDQLRLQSIISPYLLDTEQLELIPGIPEFVVASDVSPWLQTLCFPPSFKTIAVIFSVLFCTVQGTSHPILRHSQFSDSNRLLLQTNTILRWKILKSFTGKAQPLPTPYLRWNVHTLSPSLALNMLHFHTFCS